MNFEDYEKLGHLLKEARRIIFTQEWVSPKKASKVQKKLNSAKH